MDLETSNGKVLKYGVYAAVAVIALGLVLHIAGVSFGMTVMTAGIALMIIVPFLGILVSVAALYTQKDGYWLKVALLLACITAVGMAVAYF